MAANRNYANGGKIWAMHVYPVMLDVSVLIGATGAVTSFVGSTIKSVTRISAGKYQINFMDSYTRLFNAHGSLYSAGGGLSGIGQVEIQNNPNASVSSTSAPSLTVTCLNGSLAATDPANGSTLSVMIYLSNSQVTIQGE